MPIFFPPRDTDTGFSPILFVDLRILRQFLGRFAEKATGMRNDIDF